MFKSKFQLPENKIYLCGHSLGPMPKTVGMQLEQTVQDWSHYAVQAWNECDWINLPDIVSSKVAKLIGASKHEIVMSDSTSVNLFKVLMSALKLNSKRNIILTTKENFPADLYIAQGIVAFNAGINMKVVESSDILQYLDETIAVLMLTHVNYRDASVYDMEKITNEAHRLGVLVVWDLSHSVGAIPVNLTACHADFAVGCTYKYLHGGPGSPAFVYVNERHHDVMQSPIYGWIGHQAPFEFALDYQSVSVQKYMGGTPYIFGLKSLEGAIEIFKEIDMPDLYALNLENSLFLIDTLESVGLKSITSKQAPRGAHVALIHEHGYALSRALIDHGIICDYRHPDLIRLCVNGLYIDKNDITVFRARLKMIIEKKLYLNKKYQQVLKVT